MEGNWRQSGGPLGKYYCLGAGCPGVEPMLILHSFEYHAPETLAEALALAEKYGDESKFLAGGQSLLPLMKLGFLSPGHIIDLGRVKGLDYITEEDGVLAIGGLTRMADVGRSGVLLRDCPALTDCASRIADPVVRNMGTIGGNVCHADPANDVPAAVVASSAEILLAGPRGERVVPAPDFFVDTFTTALEKGEVLKEIRLQAEKCRGSAYVKLQRQNPDFAIVGVAARIWSPGDEEVKECGIALTNVGPTVVRSRKAEEAVEGNRPGAQVFSRAGELAASDARPTGDLRGSAEYKREMAAVITRRALAEAHRRAGGEPR